MSIGRAEANDVVLDAVGVSRRHVRIWLRGGRFFAEDLQSQGGTRINGVPLEEPRELSSGDTLTVGPAVLAFEARSRSSGPKPAPGPAEPPEPSMGGATDPQTTAPVSVQFFADPRPPTGPPGPAPVLESAALLQAVIRTRLRREAGSAPAGRQRLLDRLLPPRLRWRLAFGMALVMVLAAAGLWFVPRPGPGARQVEPAVLGARPVEDSFGLGEGVVWERPDFKAFSFEFNPTARALLLLRYQASQISSNEVGISVNGIDLGMVPPDSHNVAERELELVLPPAALKRGERNELIFDNLKNPPGRERWRIWNLSLETVPLPELPPDELIASATRYAEQGARLYRERQEESGNLFNAWKAYRFAWIALEGLDQKPGLYREVCERTQAIARELDDKCGGLLLQAQGAIELKNQAEAKEALEEVSRYFPTGEHRCHNRALEMLARYGL